MTHGAELNVQSYLLSSSRRQSPGDFAETYQRDSKSQQVVD